MIIFWAAIKPARPAEIPEIPTTLHLGRSTSSLLGNIQFKHRWLFLFELLKRIICKSCLNAEEYKKLIEFLRQYSFNNLELTQSSVASTIIEHSFKEFKFKEWN